MLKQLLGDFRAVEEKFKEITQQVQRRQNEGRDTRGGILEFALDAEDVLGVLDLLQRNGVRKVGLLARPPAS